MRTEASTANAAATRLAAITTIPNAAVEISGTSPTAQTTIASTSPEMAEARREVSEGAAMITWMFTLAATITSPARAAAAPSIATSNSCHCSSAPMFGC